jgi:hypothetical protein
MPNVTWPLGCDNLGRGIRIILRARPMNFLENSSHSRWAQVQPRPAKGFSEPDLSHRRTKGF